MLFLFLPCFASQLVTLSDTLALFQAWLGNLSWALTLSISNFLSSPAKCLAAVSERRQRCPSPDKLIPGMAGFGAGLRCWGRCCPTPLLPFLCLALILHSLAPQHRWEWAIISMMSPPRYVPAANGGINAHPPPPRSGAVHPCLPHTLPRARAAPGHTLSSPFPLAPTSCSSSPQIPAFSFQSPALRPLHSTLHPSPHLECSGAQLMRTSEWHHLGIKVHFFHPICPTNSAGIRELHTSITHTRLIYCCGLFCGYKERLRWQLPVLTPVLYWCTSK